MNYNEWYKSMPSLGISEEAIAGVAWRACKEEVLKILRDHDQEIEWYADLIKRIEKL